MALTVKQLKDKPGFKEISYPDNWPDDCKEGNRMIWALLNGKKYKKSEKDA